MSHTLFPPILPQDGVTVVKTEHYIIVAKTWEEMPEPCAECEGWAADYPGEVLVAAGSGYERLPVCGGCLDSPALGECELCGVLIGRRVPVELCLSRTMDLVTKCPLCEPGLWFEKLRVELYYGSVRIAELDGSDQPIQEASYMWRDLGDQARQFIDQLKKQAREVEYIDKTGVNPRR